MGGFWSASVAQPTPTHLDGVWSYGQIPLTVAGDAVPGDYQARTAEGIHVRYFSMGTSAPFALQSEEYMLAGITWEDPTHNYYVTADRSCQIGASQFIGDWAVAQSGGGSRTQSVTWDSANGGFELMLPYDVSSAAGTWTIVGIASVAWSAGGNPVQFLYTDPSTNPPTAHTVTFIAWDQGAEIIGFTDNDGSNTLTYSYDASTQTFVNVAGGGLVWQAPVAFVAIGAYPATTTLVEVGATRFRRHSP